MGVQHSRTRAANALLTTTTPATTIDEKDNGGVRVVKSDVLTTDRGGSDAISRKLRRKVASVELLARGGHKLNVMIALGARHQCLFPSPSVAYYSLSPTSISSSAFLLPPPE